MPRPVLPLVLTGLLWGVCGGRGDTLFVSSYGNGDIVKLDSVTGANLGVFASTGVDGPMGLAFDGSGNLFVADLVVPKIEKFTPAGIGSVFANKSGQFWYPYGMAIDNAGNVFVANAANNSIEMFTPGGVGSVFATTGLDGPTGLVFDAAGNLYVANAGNNTIVKFTENGIGSVFANTGLNGPMGLAFDATGNLYAANWGDNTIEKFTPEGEDSRFASTGQYGALGLTIDSAGNVFAANYHATTIERITPDGVGSVFTSAGLIEPAFIAIQPIPEPSVFAFLGLSVSSVFIFQIQRRHKKAHCRDRPPQSLRPTFASSPTAFR